MKPRSVLAWAVYWVGDAVSWLDSRIFGRWECTSLYPLYNRIMLWSGDIQGQGPGPWQTPPWLPSQLTNDDKWG